MDVSQYLDIFIDETKEHLQNLNTQILELEQDSENMDTINEIFRAAHSLKGMAGTMGYKRMQTLTHDMENVFSEVRNNNIKVNDSMIDVLFQCLDALENYLSNIQQTADEGTEENQPLIQALNEILSSKNKPAEPEKKEEAPANEPQNKENTDKNKWKAIRLGDVENHVISEAATNGIKTYGISVYIQESCILKAARAFLVFKSLEEIGEIIKSVPSTQDIEDEKFDLNFKMFIVSESPIEKILAAVKNVSEIKDAVGENITLEAPETESKEEASTEVAAPVTTPATNAIDIINIKK